MACCILDVVQDITTFYYMIARNIARPVVSWQLQHETSRKGSASITVSSDIAPTKANMWWAVTEATVSATRREICARVLSLACSAQRNNIPHADWPS